MLESWWFPFLSVLLSFHVLLDAPVLPLGIWTRVCGELIHRIVGLCSILSCLVPSSPFPHWDQLFQCGQGDHCVASSIVLALGSMATSNLEAQRQSQPSEVPGVLTHFIFINSGWSNKNIGCWNNTYFLLAVLEAKSPMSRHQHGQALVRVANCHCLSVSSHFGERSHLSLVLL